jgi:tetratricopeptide (TPR) repeat protein
MALFPSLLFSQKSMMNDLAMYDQVKEGLDKSYNFEFEEAKKIFKTVKEKYPDHPAYPFLMAGNMYWEMAYYDNYKEKSGEYFKYLEESLSLASKFLAKNPKDVEGVFFTMVAESSMALYYAERDEDMKCINHAKKAYGCMKEGFTLKSKFVDFYFSTGLYDYFVVQYPETHPVYRPFMFFFSKGDKKRGIEELEYAIKNGFFSKTECLHYLANIYLKYESKPDKAVVYSTELAKKYPRNFYFISRHIEGLLGTKNYKEAESFTNKLFKTGKKAYTMRAHVFTGMLNEYYYKNQDEALKQYQTALKLSTEITAPINDFISFAYAGMARVYFRKGDTTKAVDCYKKALKGAEYEWVKKEANDFLEKYD